MERVNSGEKDCVTSQVLAQKGRDDKTLAQRHIGVVFSLYPEPLELKAVCVADDQGKPVLIKRINDNVVGILLEEGDRFNYLGFDPDAGCDVYVVRDSPKKWVGRNSENLDHKNLFARYDLELQRYGY